MTTQTETRTIEATLDRWIAAEIAGDTGALEQLLTDDYIGIGPLGFMLTKADWLQRYESGALKTVEMRQEERMPRLYGDAAVVVSKQVQTVSYQGNPMSGEFRTSHVLIKQGGDWKIAGQQISPIGAPPVPPQQRP
jgi:ketosteroid isomerase-like protein